MSSPQPRTDFAPLATAASMTSDMFCLSSVMYGSTGESQTPVVIPLSDNFFNALSLLFGEGAFGSSSFAMFSSRVVIVNETVHQVFDAASLIKSMSRNIRSDFVPMANGQLCFLRTSRICRVSWYFFSAG